MSYHEEQEQYVVIDKQIDVLRRELSALKIKMRKENKAVNPLVGAGKALTEELEKLDKIKEVKPAPKKTKKKTSTN